MVSADRHAICANWKENIDFYTFCLVSWALKLLLTEKKGYIHDEVNLVLILQTLLSIFVKLFTFHTCLHTILASCVNIFQIDTSKQFKWIKSQF